MKDSDKRRFLLYSKLPCHKRRVEVAKATVRDALKDSKKPYVAVSWGKDSLVCLHMAIQYRPGIEVVWFDRGEGGDMPETYELASQLTAAWGLNVNRVETEETVMGAYRKAGTVFLKNNRFAKYLIKAAKQVADRDVCIKGLRASESRGRKVGLKVRGLDYLSVSGTRLVNPLGWFEPRDVWAYIVSNEIPYLPYYDDCAAIGVDYESEKSRTSNWAGTYLHEQGRVQRLKMTRRELFEQWAKEFPEVRSLA